MNILDNINQIKRLDSSNVYESVEQLGKQFEHAYDDASKVSIPKDYKNIDNIVMCGMGGSGLAARIIESLYGNRMKFPLTRVNNYKLPSWVNEKTLTVLSSFSGNTEEVISCANDSIQKKAKIISIGTGGKLEELSKSENIPFYKIVPTYNPSNQPRLAIGYSVIGQLILVAKSNIINIAKNEINEIQSVTEGIVNKNSISVKSENNLSKKHAYRLKEKIVILISAEHMTGAIHTVKNQLNENTKTFSCRFDIPELNHHLMEGLKHPDTNKNNLIFYFVGSDLYPERIQKRLDITREIVEKSKIESISWKPESKNKLSQVFEFIQFGGFISFYLSMIYGINPAPIPWVDYFKERLAK